MSSSPSLKQLKAMAVDFNSIARHRLKQICHSLEEFDQVDQSSDIRAAIDRISARHSRLDIVFISSKFEPDEIKHFIAWAKKIEATQDAAFVMIMGVNDKGSTAEARCFINGGDGVLYEPFSTDQLREMSALAIKVRADRTQTRLAAHLHGMVNDMFSLLGDIAFLRQSNYSFAPVVKKFKKISSIVEGLQAEQTHIYYDALIERSAKGPASKPTYPKHFAYPGKSNRARKRMQKKTLRALGYEAGE